MPVLATFAERVRQDTSLSIGGPGSARQDLQLYVAGVETLHFDLALSVAAAGRVTQDLRLRVISNPAAYFEYGDQLVFFTRAPQRPRKKLRLLQEQQQNAGGQRFAADPLTDENLLDLRWVGMSGGELRSLEVFFAEVVDGMAQPFIYRDATGVLTQVCFAVPEIDNTEIAPDRFNVSLHLMVV